MDKTLIGCVGRSVSLRGVGRAEEVGGGGGDAMWEKRAQAWRMEDKLVLLSNVAWVIASTGLVPASAWCTVLGYIDLESMQICIDRRTVPPKEKALAST